MSMVLSGFLISVCGHGSDGRDTLLQWRNQRRAWTEDASAILQQEQFYSYSFIPKEDCLFIKCMNQWLSQGSTNQRRNQEDMGLERSWADVAEAVHTNQKRFFFLVSAQRKANLIADYRENSIPAVKHGAGSMRSFIIGFIISTSVFDSCCSV